jgi:hypothetical protein
MIGGKLAMEDLCLLARSLACDVHEGNFCLFIIKLNVIYIIMLS